MIHLNKQFFKNHWPKILSIFFFATLFTAYVSTFAVFTPGQTLDPNCAPGAVGCTVTASSSPWLTASTDTYISNGNVGIGTSTPGSLLDIETSSMSPSYTQDNRNVSGLNDATYSGSYTGAILPNWIYVWIDSVGATDTFSYSDDNGDCSEVNDVPITGSPQLICNGISITFSATTGHSMGDEWDYEIYSYQVAFHIGDGTNNFFTVNAGVNESNFLGTNAGSGATNANDSNFLGTSAGQNATNAHNSNFFGVNAGYLATSASNSNFFGYNAGRSATNASNSNFFGYEAGRSATNALNSIFIGREAGYLDTVDNTTNGLSSILIGSFTNTDGYTNSILLGSGVSGTPIQNTKNNQFMLAPSVTEMRLSGVDYSLPASQGAASTVLTNDGSGGLSWAAAGGGGGGSSPITVVNTTNLFSTGLTGTGSGVTTATDSIFLGVDAGNGATAALYSNFIGPSAGYLATNASNSNFLGSGAGDSAINASHSNFLGSAGISATNASNSNFLGNAAGNNATYAMSSNFLGPNSGGSATNAELSNFLGPNSGATAINASYSNFFGPSAGYFATNASYSNFFGSQAGSYATNAKNSIFIGQNAGINDTVDNTTNGLSSILIGSFTNTGGKTNSILLGSGVSGTPIQNTKNNQFMLAPSVTEMRLRGVDYSLPASQGAASTVLTNDGSGGLSWAAAGGGGGSSPWLTNGTNNYYNAGKVGIGTSTPGSLLDINTSSMPPISYTQTFYENDGMNNSLNDATYSGSYTGASLPNWIYLWIDSVGATDTFSYSDDNGDCAEVNNVPITGSPQLICDGISITFSAITGHSMGDEWDYEIYYSKVAFHIGDGTNNFFRVNAVANESNFLGTEAGYFATNASRSNFLGMQAGYSATNAGDSNFFGAGAGQSAVEALFSNFFGPNTGAFATNASHSNFFSYQAGQSAINANNSNFFGMSAGYEATNASTSNFLGSQTGYQATNAKNSIFIGQQAGMNDTVNNTTNDLSSILIGSFTNTGGFSNSILLGSGTTLSPIANTKINQFMLAPTVTEMRLRGVDYSLPASQGAASTVLTNDGSGGLTWAAVSGSGISLTTTGSSGAATLVGSVLNVPQYVAGTGLSSDAFLNTKGGTSAGLNLGGTAQKNTFIGYGAGKGEGTTNIANYNTAVGYYSMFYNNSGTFNSAFGSNSLFSNIAGSLNTAIGDSSMYYNTSGTDNTALGYQSLYANSSGVGNTAIGRSSLSANTTGTSNLGGGWSSSANNTIGSNNVGLGYESLLYNKTGSKNVAVGSRAMIYADDSLVARDTFNTAIGYEALRGGLTAASNTGAYNTATGSNALFITTSGSQNTANGLFSLLNNTTGSRNTAMGSNSGAYATGSVINTTSNDSVYLGSDTRAFADGDTNEIVIGYATTGNGSNTTTIGTGNVLYVGGGSIGTNSKVARFTNASGSCDITPVTGGISCSSDINLKKNITTLEGKEFVLQTIPTSTTEKTSLEKIMEITPVNYNWNAENDSDAKHIGFIAQEMEQIFPSIVSTDTNGTIDPITGKTIYLKSISYASITPYLVQGIQEMNLKIGDLQDITTNDPDKITLGSLIRTFLADIGNGIEKIFVKEIDTKNLCVSDESGAKTCLSKVQLDALLSSQTAAVGGSGGGSSTPPIAGNPPVLLDLTLYNEALEKIIGTNYTEESFAIYQSIVNENSMTEANSQTEIDTAVSNILAAQNDLVEKIVENIQ